MECKFAVLILTPNIASYWEYVVQDVKLVFGGLQLLTTEFKVEKIWHKIKINDQSSQFFLLLVDL